MTIKMDAEGSNQQSTEQEGQRNFFLEELLPEELETQVERGLFYKVENVKEHFSLHPFWLSSPKTGVMEELRKKLGKWHPRLEGYVVGFGDVRNETTTAALNNDHQYLHLDVFITFFLYKPEVDQISKGCIKKVGEKAVICTMFNVFSATVFPETMEEISQWQVGDVITFKIYAFQNRRKGPIIRAKSLSYSDHVTSPKRKKKKKRRESELDGFEDSTSHVMESAYVHENNLTEDHSINLDESPKKKSKKRKRESSCYDYDANETLPIDNEVKYEAVEDPMEEYTKPKKRSKKKSTDYEEHIETISDSSSSPKKKKKKRSYNVHDV